MRDRSSILVYGFMLMLGMARPALAQDKWVSTILAGLDSCIPRQGSVAGFWKGDHHRNAKIGCRLHRNLLSIAVRPNISNTSRTRMHPGT
jgi:hypothetical protein